MCLNRPAVEAETFALQAVSSVAGPAVPLYWGPRRRHFSRYACVFNFHTFCFTWKFRCLSITNFCIFQMSRVFCSKEMFFIPGQKNFRYWKFSYLLTLMYFQTYVWLYFFSEVSGVQHNQLHNKKKIFLKNFSVSFVHIIKVNRVQCSDFHYMDTEFFLFFLHRRK